MSYKFCQKKYFFSKEGWGGRIPNNILVLLKLGSSQILIKAETKSNRNRKYMFPANEKISFLLYNSKTRREKQSLRFFKRERGRVSEREREKVKK